MEIRDWSIQILAADTIEDKLFVPVLLTDENPGAPLFWDEPTRPRELQFKKHSKEDKLPPFHTHHTLENRIECLHRFAGHELLAVEIMAFALLAFPEAPKSFRKGLANTLREEQGHVKLYTQRLEAMGAKFGHLPLFRHFWRHTPYLYSPLQYISMMSLTFEQANLDFAPMYGKSFERHGDIASAELMAIILRDEISHVRFGWRWLCNFKETNLSHWDAWQKALPPEIHPKRAKGFIMNENHRQEAGLDLLWIENLKKC